MLKTGVSLSPPWLVVEMIGVCRQEYSEDPNKEAEDVISALIVNSHTNTYVCVPCQMLFIASYKRVQSLHQLQSAAVMWICGV